MNSTTANLTLKSQKLHFSEPAKKEHRSQKMESPTEIMNQRYLAFIKEFALSEDLPEIRKALDPKATRVKWTQFAPDCSQNSYLTLLDRQDYIIGNYTNVLHKNSAREAVPIISAQERGRIVDLL